MFEIQFSDNTKKEIAFNDFENMAKVADSVKGITIKDEDDLEKLDFLEKFPKLEILTVTNCEKISNIKPISSLKKLKSLNLCSTGSVKIRDFSPITELKDLEELQLAGSQFIKDIKFLAGLINIKFLNFDFCSWLEDISGIDHITKLQSLHIQECNRLKPSLPKIQNLIDQKVFKDFKYFTPP